MDHRGRLVWRCVIPSSISDSLIRFGGQIFGPCWRCGRLIIGCGSLCSRLLLWLTFFFKSSWIIVTSSAHRLSSKHVRISLGYVCFEALGFRFLALLVVVARAEVQWLGSKLCGTKQIIWSSAVGKPISIKAWSHVSSKFLSPVTMLLWSSFCFHILVSHVLVDVY